MAVAQTPSLSVSTAAVAPGATAALNLSLSGSAGPASLQWTLSYPAASVSGFAVNAGPVLSAAGKSLTCASSTGTYKCIATGLNASAIADGIVATVSVTPSVSSGSITIGLSTTMAASPAGGAWSVAGSAGAVTVTSAPSLLSSFGCNPASISVPGTSGCTVNLSGPAPAGGLSLSVTSNNTNLTVPSSVLVPAGSASATFSASGATVTGTQNATVTVTLNSSSLNASLTLLGPTAPVSSVPPTSIACTPSSLAPGGSSICTLILSNPAPGGGTAVSLISSSSALTVPAAATVVAGSTSTTFTAQAAPVAAAQSAVITASAMGSALTESLVLNPAAGQNLLRVGPGRTYASPCQALTAAPDGAMIQIDASGSYSGDVCTITANNITVKGINGRPLINAAGLNSAGQAVWVFQGNDITVDTIELTGAASPTNNGAAIFMAGQNLTILNSYIHDNEVGLLSAPSPNSQVLIQAAEFYDNGFGDGLTHNIDVAPAARFTLQYSYSHNAIAGDLVKSQAAENYILFNRLTSEQGTTLSEIDLPAGGRSFVVGNLIEKGPGDSGLDLIAYLLGSGTANPSAELYVVNNTMVSDNAASVNFLDIGSSSPTPAVVTNNIFFGTGAASTQPNSVLNGNLTADPLFVNQPGYDYHLSAGSPAIDAGSLPGSGDGVSLTPAFQYLDPTCGQARMIINTIDIGAYEYGGAGVPLYCGLTVSAITLNPASVLGGAVTTANAVSLTVPAPPAGAVVTLTSSNPTVAAVPATVTIPSGALSARFNITTAGVTSSSTVTITASYSGGSQSVNLTVTTPFSLSGVQCSPTTLSSGASSSCKAILTAAAPAGGSIITLSTSSSLLKVPASVTVPAGSTSITFSALAGTIAANQSVTLTAALNGVSKAITLNLTSAPVVGLSSFACTPLLLHSYQISNCTIKLSGAAPAGGTAVGVVSSTGRLTVPSTVTVPAGATSATFTAQTGRVRYSRTATVTATLGSGSLTVNFQLSP